MSAPLEEPKATWDKRFKQRHYSYRDCATTTTPLLTVPQLLAIQAAINNIRTNYTTGPATVLGLYAAVGAYYPFGTVARTIDIYNWPTLGDPIGPSGSSLQTYAREIVVQCTQNTWIRIISANPEYLRQATLQALTEVVPSAPQFIIEAEQYIPANQPCRFFPTYGIGITYRADTVSGTITIWSEANVEGTE
jgi:hypothetical protein